jgi:type IV secretory pathway TrbD component
MQRSQRSSVAERNSGREAVSIVGILLTGIVAAFALPLWMAALCMLLAVAAIGVIARHDPVVEPVVIRRDERR